VLLICCVLLGWLVGWSGSLVELFRCGWLDLGLFVRGGGWGGLCCVLVGVLFVRRFRR